MGLDSLFWKDKRVLVIGHTGFKGSWLTCWLGALGARVSGYSLEAPSEPNLFQILGLEKDLNHYCSDIRNLNLLRECFEFEKPEIVFHLAAQSLVRKSYSSPVDTYETNVMGVVNVLEACRLSESVKAVINVTSDKCYENKEHAQAFREIDPMGGYDPYSSSKACAELITSSYRCSFMQNRKDDVSIALASVRAGNVIGGGDWAEDRLIPDVVRAMHQEKPIVIRHPNAIRSWQHVLDPLHGYLMLAERLFSDGSHHYEEGWNFGALDDDVVTVKDLITMFVNEWEADTTEIIYGEVDELHEASTLKLDCTKAYEKLGWQTTLNMKESIKWTRDWYMAWNEKRDLRAVTLNQVNTFQELSKGNS